MSELLSKYDIPKKELGRGNRLVKAAVAAPVALTVLPAVLFSALFVLFGSAPPVAVTLLFFGVLSTVIGLLIGLIISGILVYRRSNWTTEMRERIAADGIKAAELHWFMHEIKAHEKRALRQIEQRDLLLGDAYRETLASRLTATRIVRSSKRELALMERRKGKLKTLGSGRGIEFVAEIERDVQKLKKVNTDANQMLIESEARLQMLEVSSIRGGGLADNEIALKKLYARSAELPLALEEARMADEIWRELEADDSEKQLEE